MSSRLGSKATSRISAPSSRRFCLRSVSKSRSERLSVTGGRSGWRRPSSPGTARGRSRTTARLATGTSGPRSAVSGWRGSSPRTWPGCWIASAAKGTSRRRPFGTSMRSSALPSGVRVRTGRVTRNVATLVEVPAKVRRELHPLSADQVQTVLESVATDRLGPLHTTAVALGMCQGELLALRWADVDLDADTVSVRPWRASPRGA
jgi:hypothetical protein